MRILVLLATLFALASPATAQAPVQGWQPTDGQKLVFDVFRDGGAFGTHMVAFKKTGDTLSVDTDVELRVDLGPLNLFHYVLDATERYVGGKLTWVGSRSKNDGQWKTLSAEAVEGGLQVKGSKFKGLLKGIVIPSSHWNIEEMKQPSMLSTETGEMLKITVTDKGIERVKTGKGMIDARRYFVKSDIEASFWYDADGRWVKCAFTTQGSKIEYVLRDLPQ